MKSYMNLVPVEERILLYLLNWQGSKKKPEASIELTQNGIAEAVGSHRNYIPRPMKNLVANGHIQENFGRIKGGKKKQKYYLLTNKGKKFAKKLKNDLSNRQVTLRFSDGVSKSMPIKNIIPHLEEHEICPDVTDMDIYMVISGDSVLDIEHLKKVKKIHYIDHSADAPKVMRFFGRKREKALIERWIGDIEGHNIIFIHGIAGIGKTTLAAKLIEKYRGQKHLFWHNFHNLDSPRGVLLKLSEFISELGDDHLEMHLRTRTTIDYYEVAKILRKSMGIMDAVLIFDDFQKSNDRIREFFIYILKMLASPSKTKMLILSREIVPFYDGRDVISRDIVAEMELEGLDFESSKRLLKEKGIDKSMFKEIYGLTAGNPLFLEFFESKGQLERYVHDELFLKLEDDERRILGIMSIYRFPIPEESFSLVDDFDFEKLYVLARKSIVKKDAHERYFIHDIIKHFFYSRLSPSTRRGHHLHAAKWYKDRNEPVDQIEAIYHYLEGGEHKEAAKFAIDNSSSILDSGYAGEFLTTLERFDDKYIEANIWSELLIIKGKTCYMGGEWKKALLYFTQSSDIASVIGNHELKVRAICESGHVLEEQNQFNKAMECFKVCLDISEKTEYLPGMGEAYRGIGRVHWRNSEHNEAILAYEKCLEISEKVNNLELLASTYIDLGNVYDEKFEAENAIECYNKSLDILEKTKNISETARAYGNLAIMYRNMEEFEKAIEYETKQLELAKNLHDLKLIGYGYAGVSYCYAKIKDLANARDFVEKAEEIASKIDNENIIYQVNKTYALISREKKKWEDAVKYLEKNIVLVEKLKTPFSLSDTHYELGRTYEEMGDLNKAKKHFNIASNLYDELGLGKKKFVKDKLQKYHWILNK